MEYSHNSPEPTGVLTDGTQQASDQVEIVESSQMTELAPVITSLRGLMSTNSKATGGQAVTSLLSGITSRLEKDLELCKQRNDNNEIYIKSLNEEMTDLKVDKAVLQEKVETSTSTRHIRNISITIGTAMMTFSPTFFNTEKFYWVGIVSVAIGFVLVIVGWLNIGQKGGKK